MWVRCRGTPPGAHLSAMTRTVPAALLGIVLSACSAGEAEVRALHLSEAIQREQVEHLVRTFAVEAPRRALELASERAHVPGLREVFDAGGLPADTTDLEREAVAIFLEARAWRPGFVVAGELTRDGVRAAEAIAHADRHAIDPASLGALEVAARVAALRDGAHGVATLAALALDESDEDRLVAWMQERAALDATLPAADAVFEAIATPGRGNPIPRYADAIADAADAIGRAATAGPELELVLVRGLVRYGTRQLWGNANLVLPAEATERGWDLDDADDRAAAIRARVLDGALGLARAEDLEGAVAALVPPGEQYPRLVAGLAEYRGYVEAGGWGEIPFTRERRTGDTGAAIAALRERLAAERYLAGHDGSDRFDTALRAALLDYQRTHQLSESGTLTEETARSLSVSAARRMAQIEVTMERWRSARSTRDVHRERIVVSVPDFHGELWDRDERIARWRVVAGRPMNTRGPDGDEVVRGRTVLFSDTMLYIVFNPFWNVPQEIRRHEYQAQIDADPNWLVDNGFEIVVNADGSDFLRQLPGPENLLGAVKFLFPNEHDIYMHDTPSKRLFERPIRAFSHGCIRTQDPLELAHILIARDREWTDLRTERFIEEQRALETEQWFTLRRPLPVHIEYFTVRGDDDGRMNFLADIYRYDRADVDAAEARIVARYGLEAGGDSAPEPVALPVGSEGGTF